MVEWDVWSVTESATMMEFWRGKQRVIEWVRQKELKMDGSWAMEMEVLSKIWRDARWAVKWVR